MTSQLDLIGEREVCSSWGCAEPTFRSDHRAMKAVFSVDNSGRKGRSGQARATGFSGSLKNWEVGDAIKLYNFRCAAELGLRRTAADIDMTIDKKLAEAEKTITEVATQCGKARARATLRRPTCSRELKPLESRASCHDTPADERR